MGKFLDKKKIDESIILSELFRLFMKLQYLFVSDKKYIANTFRKRFKKELNWRNPSTYQEKLQWLKMYHRNDLQTKCADKVAVRDFVKKVIGEEYLIPQPLVLENGKDLVPEILPDRPFIVKCNHNSAAYTIVKNKFKINWGKERKKFNNLLKQNYYYQSREWQYKNIPPRIIIEELLVDEEGNIPLDYKFYCFNGKPKIIHVSVKKNQDHYVLFFDLNWNKLPLKYADYSNEGPFSLQKPVKLTEMINLSEKLSAHNPFVRIDFYQPNKKIFFGEITYHPSSGLLHYEPEEFNQIMGDWIDLSNIKK
ncbi:ATP-grasp fold amidoligase family protein [Robiginitalea sp. IMCC44478]|uniref:ATP-grasp fold amidoligase family protein n=1 Tax=Robiginitalea sp. IMCC44478 TaxID=3459122 RepID=UPI0040416880